ncbi:hypothetical protein M0802_010842 [Mischocyttarus mexicanus]|nr:hypothetical protein M0802_010842 [Mischocyttarus mexicanus]
MQDYRSRRGNQPTELSSNIYPVDKKGQGRRGKRQRSSLDIGVLADITYGKMLQEEEERLVCEDSGSSGEELYVHICVVVKSCMCIYGYLQLWIWIWQH